MIPDPANNPFAVLTAVAAPAILTNACSVLALGTANRIARVVDRTRVVIGLQEPLDEHHPDHGYYAAHLETLRKRGNLLFNALRLFYAALAMFAATALTAIIGSAMVGYGFDLGFHLAAIFGFAAGACAVIALVAGCGLMVRETRLAIHSLEEEHKALNRNNNTVAT